MLNLLKCKIILTQGFEWIQIQHDRSPREHIIWKRYAQSAYGCGALKDALSVPGGGARWRLRRKRYLPGRIATEILNADRIRGAVCHERMEHNMKRLRRRCFRIVSRFRLRRRFRDRCKIAVGSEILRFTFQNLK